MEKLIQGIMKDLKCSREDAEEVAKMELKAKGLKRYEQSNKPRAKTQKERKVDEDKKYLLGQCFKGLVGKAQFPQFKNETEISFEYKGEQYTLKLIKHRKEKK